MRRLITIIILCIGIFMNADAQTFTQRIQKPVAGQGTVTIHQDSVIDRLVNNATLGIKSDLPSPLRRSQLASQVLLVSLVKLVLLVLLVLLVFLVPSTPSTPPRR